MRNRILELRKERGLTLTTLAQKIGVTSQQIGRLEKGERRLTTDWMEKIALALEVLPEDLMSSDYGDRVVIPEVDINIPLEKVKGGKASSVSDSTNILSEWALPKTLVENQVGSNSTMRIIQVMGDSMQPEFNPGERIMVNTADRMPSPPGIFVISDGFGLIIKRCEMIPHSNPARVTLSSTNEKYAKYEMDLSEVQIQGRVIGKWQWT